MIQKVTVLLSVMGFAVLAQASHLCSVQGENPNEAGTYDQLLDHKEVDFSKGDYMYQTAEYTAWAAARSGGGLSVSSYVPNQRKVHALVATDGKTVFLLDGKNNVMISCFEK